METREVVQGKSVQELEAQLLEQDSNKILSQEDRASVNMAKEILSEKVPYLQRNRGYGQGNVRIGQSIEGSDDIYSLTFISQISNEIMDKYFDVIKGELKEGEEEKEEELEEEHAINGESSDEDEFQH